VVNTLKRWLPSSQSCMPLSMSTNTLILLFHQRMHMEARWSQRALFEELAGDAFQLLCSAWYQAHDVNRASAHMRWLMDARTYCLRTAMLCRSGE
jgi:hypothetical protein